MKKLLLLLTISSLSLGAFAQKQSEGAQTIETEFSPLGANPIKISSLRYRYFINDNTALRSSIFIGGSRSTTTSDDEPGVPQTKGKNGKLDFSFRPGIEKHFEGTDKLSPYFGGELFLGLNKTRNSQESIWSANNNIQTSITKTSQFSFGLNAILGTDYYFTDNFYLGVELGFGFLRESPEKTKITVDNPETPTPEIETVGNTTEFTWGPNYQGTIRLGWIIRSN